MKRLLPLILMFAGVSHGQTITPCSTTTPANAVCLQVTAPTTHEDGSPIVLAISYRYEQQAGASWNTIATGTSRRHLVTNLAPGTYTFRAIAVENNLDSRPSNTVTVTIAPSPPNPPVLQVSQVVAGVDHAPVFTVLADGSRSTTVGGFAAVGTECEGPVLFRYRNRDYRKPVSWKPWSTSSTVRVAAPCA